MPRTRLPTRTRGVSPALLAVLPLLSAFGCGDSSQPKAIDDAFAESCTGVVVGRPEVKDAAGQWVALDEAEDAAPVHVRACASTITPQAGQEFVVRVLATDADAVIAEGCDGRTPRARFGDEDPSVRSSASCSCAMPPPGDDDPDGAGDAGGRREKTFTHTYATPGRYTVSIEQTSGLPCSPGKGAGMGRVVFEVEVTA